MLIFKYLAKQVFSTMAAITIVITVIFMSNQLVWCLNLAASGKIPPHFILKLFMLEFPIMLWLILPLGYFIALLLSCTQLYADSEMTALNACGYGPGHLLKHCLIIASIVALFAFIVTMWLRPAVMAERIRILHTPSLENFIKTITPMQFQAVKHGQQIVYAGAINAEHTEGKHLFLAQLDGNDSNQQWDILWVEAASLERNEETGAHYLTLNKGEHYRGMPGQADYQVSDFNHYTMELPTPNPLVFDDIRTVPLNTLWPVNNDPRKASELQWRLSIPLMILTLTLVAVPLSRVNPRGDIYAKLLPAIILFMVQGNLVSLSRKWIMFGTIPSWLGMWWIHMLVALLGIILFWFNPLQFRNKPLRIALKNTHTKASTQTQSEPRTAQK